MEKSNKKIHDSVISQNNLDSIGKRLKRALNLLGYSQAGDFFEKHKNEIKRSTFYAILNGQVKNPGSNILMVFQKAGIDVAYLLTGQGEPLLSESTKRKIKDAAQYFRDVGRGGDQNNLLQNDEEFSQGDATGRNIKVHPAILSEQGSGQDEMGSLEKRRQAINKVKQYLREHSMEKREGSSPEVIQVDGKDFLETMVALIYNCNAEEIEMISLMIKKRMREEFKKEV